jgi:superfamily II DNA helicase RecQ
MSAVFTGYAQGLGAQVLERVSHANNLAIPPVRNPPIIVHPHLLKAITPLLPYGKPPAFTLPQQAEAVQSSTSDCHVLVVMPTGSGKSLSFFAAPLLMPTKMFIVVTPLVALTNDMSRRLASTGIEGGKWSNRIDPFTARLIVVSAHQAGTQDFFLWARTNSARIQRLFVDEAHHIYTSDDYRGCFRLFDMLTELGKPLTFLSATVFPRSVPYLCERMKIDPGLLIQIRAPTTRPNLRIRVTKCQDFNSMLSSVKTLFESINLPSQDRGLIFCTKVDHCRAVAGFLGIDHYVAKLKPTKEENSEERLRLESQWREGVLPHHRWMVATLCFGQGIDFASVRWVIHLEVRNVMLYSQEIGRAGRDGNLAFVQTFYTRLPTLADRASGHDHEGVGSMIEYLETSRCRNLTLGVLDNVEHCCAALGGVLCDNCEDISLVSLLNCC